MINKGTDMTEHQKLRIQAVINKSTAELRRLSRYIQDPCILEQVDFHTRQITRMQAMLDGAK